MPEEQRYLTGCKTCEEYKAHFSGAKRQPDASPILGVGSVEVEGNGSEELKKELDKALLQQK